jgi:hypothetical protein
MPPMEDGKAANGLGRVKLAVIVACVLAVAAEAYLVWATGSGDNYTSLYLTPGSYSNFLEGNTVKFTYGIQPYGRPSGKYLLSVYMGNSLVTTRDLKQRTGTNEVMIQVPETISFPTQVRLVLDTDYGQNEVHFWLKGRRNENSTGL